jgi:hypothetical protein
MLSEPKEQYGFMRLDESSFDELFKIFNPKISKRNVNMLKQSLPVSVYPLRYAV